jgi:hypothetical protein
MERQLAQYFRETRDGRRRKADADAAELTFAQMKPAVTALLMALADE